MKKAKIILNERAHPKTVHADLLPCTIRADLASPQMYVANDLFKSDSIFVLEAMRMNDESDDSEQSDNDEIIGFSLVLHLNNVSSLKRFEDEDE